MEEFFLVSEESVASEGNKKTDGRNDCDSICFHQRFEGKNPIGYSVGERSAEDLFNNGSL